MNYRLIEDKNNKPLAKKGFSGSQSSSPASAFLTWDMDAALSAHIASRYASY